MSFHVTATNQDLSDDNGPLLVRTVRPTGTMKTCFECGACIPMGHRCGDCLRGLQREKLDEFGKPFKRGGRSPYRRFTDDEIREIRTAGRSSVKYVKELSQKYKANPNTIYNILAHETYKDVK